MRFDFTVYADNQDELSAVLKEMADAFPVNLFEDYKRGFEIRVTPTYDIGDTLTSTVRPLPPLPPSGSDVGTTAPAPVTVADPAPVAKRARRTKAEMEAARKGVAAAPLPVAPADPEPADDDEIPGDIEQAEEPEAEGEAEAAAMSPADAKLKALDMLRTAYLSPGGPANVKALQTKYGVTKFVEVPDSKGAELFEDAAALIEDLNIAQDAV